MKNPRWYWSWCSTCTAPPVPRDGVMSREGIFNRLSARTQRETRDTNDANSRIRFVRRTKKSLLLVYLRKPSPDGCFARTPCGRSCSVRARQILAQSFQAFRDVFFRERFPRFRVARIRSDVVPDARVRIAHLNSRRLISRARGKNVGENSPPALLLSSLARETRVYGPFVCATRCYHFPLRSGANSPFCDAQKRA